MVPEEGTSVWGKQGEKGESKKICLQELTLGPFGSKADIDLGLEGGLGEQCSVPRLEYRRPSHLVVCVECCSGDDTEKSSNRDWRARPF